MGSFALSVIVLVSQFFPFEDVDRAGNTPQFLIDEKENEILDISFEELSAYLLNPETDPSSANQLLSRTRAVQEGNREYFLRATPEFYLKVYELLKRLPWTMNSNAKVLQFWKDPPIEVLEDSIEFYLNSGSPSTLNILQVFWNNFDAQTLNQRLTDLLFRKKMAIYIRRRLQGLIQFRFQSSDYLQLLERLELSADIEMEVQNSVLEVLSNHLEEQSIYEYLQAKLGVSDSLLPFSVLAKLVTFRPQEVDKGVAEYLLKILKNARRGDSKGKDYLAENLKSFNQLNEPLFFEKLDEAFLAELQTLPGEYKRKDLEFFETTIGFSPDKLRNLPRYSMACLAFVWPSLIADDSTLVRSELLTYYSWYSTKPPEILAATNFLSGGLKNCLDSSDCRKMGLLYAKYAYANKASRFELDPEELKEFKDQLLFQLHSSSKANRDFAFEFIGRLEDQSFDSVVFEESIFDRIQILGLMRERSHLSKGMLQYLQNSWEDSKINYAHEVYRQIPEWGSSALPLLKLLLRRFEADRSWGGPKEVAMTSLIDQIPDPRSAISSLMDELEKSQFIYYWTRSSNFSEADRQWLVDFLKDSDVGGGESLVEALYYFAENLDRMDPVSAQYFADHFEEIFEKHIEDVFLNSYLILLRKLVVRFPERIEEWDRLKSEL